MSKSNLYNSVALGSLATGIGLVSFFLLNNSLLGAALSGMACFGVYAASRQIAVNSYDDNDHHVEP